ncbi:MAG: FAD-binding oxidoreductase [Elusimicrobia bacterium]|nr:FAD-binding oxidoreductase [Elusimicrobiota bacterium]
MMKWWGWGSPDFEFPMHEKPDLWPWIVDELNLKGIEPVKAVGRDKVSLAAPIRNDAFCRELDAALHVGQFTFDEEQRLLHSYGKSYPDLFRVRQGIVRRAPDAVVFPERHADVETIVKAAHRHGVEVIPFGGGTNIVGGVNPLKTERMVVTIDMARMNRVLSIDAESLTAVIEAGALGPKLEQDLQSKGFSLGHYPDSFEYSSLGGWVATRSAGMQSDAYGKIEHMVVALKMVTPSGTLATRNVPAASSGPDLNRLMTGSEGTLGVITECTMRIHRTPPVKDYRGFLFKSFEEGVKAIHECVNTHNLPSLIRLQDGYETQLGMRMKTPAKGIEGFIQRRVKAYLKSRGYTYPAIMIVGFEGDKAHVAKVRAATFKILKKHQGFHLGTSVGKTWSKDKFNLPYLRDYVMDYGCMVDVSETSTPWSNVLPLYHKTVAAIKERFASPDHPGKGKGFIGCHLSHTYKTGACLYFTYGARQVPGQELEQYYGYKGMITELFMKNGATLSHHHAVGTEHQPWMEEEVSRTGIQALRAIKTSLDPKAIFNPGKLIPTAAPTENGNGASSKHADPTISGR